MPSRHLHTTVSVFPMRLSYAVSLTIFTSCFLGLWHFWSELQGSHPSQACRVLYCQPLQQSGVNMKMILGGWD